MKIHLDLDALQIRLNKFVNTTPWHLAYRITREEILEDIGSEYGLDPDTVIELLSESHRAAQLVEQAILECFLCRHYEQYNSSAIDDYLARYDYTESIEAIEFLKGYAKSESEIYYVKSISKKNVEIMNIENEKVQKIENRPYFRAVNVHDMVSMRMVDCGNTHMQGLGSLGFRHHCLGQVERTKLDMIDDINYIEFLMSDYPSDDEYHLKSELNFERQAACIKRFANVVLENVIPDDGLFDEPLDEDESEIDELIDLVEALSDIGDLAEVVKNVEHVDITCIQYKFKSKDKKELLRTVKTHHNASEIIIGSGDYPLLMEGDNIGIYRIEDGHIEFGIFNQEHVVRLVQMVDQQFKDLLEKPPVIKQIDLGDYLEPAFQRHMDSI